ncbi:UNKNOWN [Stylonychia lemnae]|uniref:Uncharacterized protein n=1 Tax=Stylonychia lemnae TaxID=5949 RepID=A0A078A724_STYLE|nr:UNKNOWN [Stylonychia lemnae]|eukprot:CDW77681.1 UNKNOWN [Stylonychia lemnae]
MNDNQGQNNGTENDNWNNYDSKNKKQDAWDNLNDDPWQTKNDEQDKSDDAWGTAKAEDPWGDISNTIAQVGSKRQREQSPQNNENQW